MMKKRVWMKWEKERGKADEVGEKERGKVASCCLERVQEKKIRERKGVFNPKYQYTE